MPNYAIRDLVWVASHASRGTTHAAAALLVDYYGLNIVMSVQQYVTEKESWMNPQVMTERFEMRLSPATVDEIDAWRALQSDMPSRSEAVRRLMEQGLAAAGSVRRERPPLRIGDGEKLIILMLCDLFKKLKITGEIDPEFVEQAIYGGHYWGLAWEYSGIFHGHEDSEAVLHEVVDVLDMWSFLESGYASLSKKQKDRVAAEAEPFGKHVEFRGFDGNGESEYIGIARFLIDHLDRFTKFKGRELNAHLPTIDTHRRMLSVFGPIRRTMAGRELAADEIIEILQAMMHPSRRPLAKDSKKEGSTR